MFRWPTISLFDPYGSELHYVRGAGPKWREKYTRSAEFAGLYREENINR